jgi:hypothetical protein
MVSLLLSFGGIEGVKTEKSRGSSGNCYMSMGKSGKMGKAGSMMRIEQIWQGQHNDEQGKILLVRPNDEHRQKWQGRPLRKQVESINDPLQLPE